jgi:hypothetical protein
VLPIAVALTAADSDADGFENAESHAVEVAVADAVGSLSWLSIAGVEPVVSSDSQFTRLIAC